MIKDNYLQVKNELGDDVTVIAVTKYHSIEDTLEAYEAGIRHFGENRIDGFLNKRKALNEDAEVHFIGTLQSRKVKDIINDLKYLHSLDRVSIAKKIEQYSDHIVQCFIQVNVSEEESKHGIKKEELIPFIEDLKSFGKIKVIGLMTMAPLTKNENEIRSVFKQLKDLRDELAPHNDENIQITELSMGMSNDYLIAKEEGSTFVRIGRKIMGER